MKAPNYIIQIDAREAYKRIGVHLDDSPIGTQCVEALLKLLLRKITEELLIESLTDASKRRKPRRSGKGGAPMH